MLANDHSKMPIALGILQMHFAKFPFFLGLFKVVIYSYSLYNTYFGFKSLHHKTKIVQFFEKTPFL